ncbi:MAG TPA: hypothetical protein VF815_13465 [Myxococcaceae bacterium]|jgi:hypothetical protein
MHISCFRVAKAFPLSLLFCAGLMGCGDGVDSIEHARRAYLGLDKSVEKSLQLGFAGFNAATSANIPAQSGTGDATGTLTISGQVDQGSSANKGMRLRVGMVNYSDGKLTVPGEDDTVELTYGTATDPTAQPELTLSLRDIPNGSFTGQLLGKFQMSGDLEGEVTLDLVMNGRLEDDGTGKVRRVAGTTSIGGLATSSEGSYVVSISGNP